jgi:threonine dehydratase
VEHLLAADLAAAADLAGTVARQTPVIGARWLSEMAGREVQLKCENLQRSGSFKLRGAFVRMSRLTPQERECGVVAASAGNHAQGVALAARELGISATVFMPSGAALPKVAATKEYGAEVVLSGDIVDDALAAAQEYADRTGAVFIHPFDHRDIVLGQASVGLEILRQVPDVRTILVPTGGGGLVAGIAAAVRAQQSEAVVVGVQADRAAAYPPSMSAGHPIRLAAMSTMADGIAVARPGAVPFAILTDLHVGVRTVTEDSIARALVLLMERSKQVVEPAGVPGVSMLLEHPGGLEPPVVAVLSGGNVDPVLLQRVLRYGLAAAGRYMTVAVQVADNPGSLAALLGVLAQCSVNVLGVDHVWTDPGLAVGQVDVVVQLETRGFEHRRETLAVLRQAGYELRAGT